MKMIKKVALGVALTAMAGGAFAGDVMLTTTNNTDYCSNGGVHHFGTWIIVQANATKPHTTSNPVDASVACFGSFPCTAQLYMSSDTTGGCATSSMQYVNVNATLQSDGSIAYTNGGTGCFTDNNQKKVCVIFSGNTSNAVQINYVTSSKK